MKIRPCELCNADAVVFCPSDNAFLCRSCDAKVHEANFLVARHVRRPVCEEEDGGDLHLDSLSSSDDSSSSSSTTSQANKEYSGAGNNRESRCRFHDSSRQRGVDYCKAEGIFINWCSKLGVGVDMAAVRTARRALSVWLDRQTVLPFRVCLAASLWLGLRPSCQRRGLALQLLKRLEEISGVPAKVIIAAESKALRSGGGRRRMELELKEGWAEC